MRICRDAWPSSLRDMAGGCLGVLSERYANLSLFPALELPEEVMAMWPLQVTRGRLGVSRWRPVG